MILDSNLRYEHNIKSLLNKNNKTIDLLNKISVNPFAPNAHYLYPLKTSEKPTVF